MQRHQVTSSQLSEISFQGCGYFGDASEVAPAQSALLRSWQESRNFILKQTDQILIKGGERATYKHTLFGFLVSLLTNIYLSGYVEKHTCE